MTQKSKTILIVTSEFPPQPGGIGNHAYNLAVHLEQEGYDIMVIADQRSSDGREEELFDKLLPFKVKRTQITSPRFLMYLHRIKTLFQLKSRVYHIIATGKFSLWSVAFCTLFSKKNNVAIVHGSEVNSKNRLIKSTINLSLNQFKSIVAVSNHTKNLISYIKPPVIVIPNGLDISLWLEPPELDHMVLKGNPVLTTVGNVTSRKGQQQVIKHLSKLISEFPDIHYHCVGLKTEADRFLTLAQDLNVASHVTFHGRLSETELLSVLDKTDIFIMLSTETEKGEIEGFGIAILEANALGVPVIGAKGCGIEDAIANGRSGILVDPFNSDELLESIHQIMNTRADFKKGAKAWAEQHQWSDIVRFYIELLK